MLASYQLSELGECGIDIVESGLMLDDLLIDSPVFLRDLLFVPLIMGPDLLGRLRTFCSM